LDTETDTNATNERTNNQLEYKHKHININISSKPFIPFRNFYIPKDFEQTMVEMEKILDREGKKLSGWIRDQVQSYVNLHSLGNPQQLMQRYVNGQTKPYISADPCFLGCGRPSEFLACYGNNERRFKVCGVHADCIRHNSLKRNFQYQKWMIVGEIKP
jgi:hypothetical protein